MAHRTEAVRRPDSTGPPLTHQGHDMLEYEYHQLRSAELRREAEQARLARSVARARRAARRETREAESQDPRFRRHRFTPAA
ncbi:hypothetical protein SSTG_03542 [Streptomyces sp. e14]|nr:hypothetical protein SSTG_03542 [Streptomyces sp. e14]